MKLHFRVGQVRREVEKLYPAIIEYDGRVKWDFPIIQQSNCQLDVTYFPWDQQECALVFNSWTMDMSALDLYNNSASGLLETAISDGEWLLKEFPVKRRVAYVPAPFAVLEFTLKLERKPLYYIINIILPCVLITFCGMLVFLLPPDSGEKVSMSVTMLLSSTIFLLIVAEIMPVQSDTFPILGKYTMWFEEKSKLTLIKTPLYGYYKQKSKYGVFF